jgi:hypothetical protein
MFIMTQDDKHKLGSFSYTWVILFTLCKRYNVNYYIFT